MLKLVISKGLNPGHLREAGSRSQFRGDKGASNSILPRAGTSYQRKPMSPVTASTSPAAYQVEDASLAAGNTHPYTIAHDAFFRCLGAICCLAPLAFTPKGTRADFRR